MSIVKYHESHYVTVLDMYGRSAPCPGKLALRLEELTR